jgi:cystathionine beta-lyase family protein involved in aluminum resistance
VFGMEEAINNQEQTVGSSKNFELASAAAKLKSEQKKCWKTVVGKVHTRAKELQVGISQRTIFI